MTEEKKRYGADAIVDSLANHDVKYVFGVPGAKIDRLFERLDHPVNPKAPKLIVLVSSRLWAIPVKLE